jgi:hypothetical protein
VEQGRLAIQGLAGLVHQVQSLTQAMAVGVVGVVREVPQTPITQLAGLVAITEQVVGQRRQPAIPLEPVASAFKARFLLPTLHSLSSWAEMTARSELQ